VLVGVWDDEQVLKMKGPSNPVMSLHERVLNVSACKHVDEVLIGAPPVISAELIASMKVSAICEGNDPALRSPPGAMDLAKERGLYRLVDVPMPVITVEDIAERVAENRIAYVKRQKARVPREREFNNKADKPAEI
jgi:ethanolamine-phosphate cytidylyltransferase